MKKQKIKTVQQWLPYQQMLNHGMIILKDDTYLKIIQISPINFNLKSELEKEAILNSYQIFLKTCNFNFQILIQSNKEDLTKHIQEINENSQQETKQIQEIAKQYISYLQNLNHHQKSSSKNFYIILKYENSNKDIKNIQELAIQELNDQYFKIKDLLSRCGNFVTDISEKEQIISILFSFLNSRIYFNKNEIKRR